MQPDSSFAPRPTSRRALPIGAWEGALWRAVLGMLLASLSACGKPGDPLDTDALERAERETTSLVAETQLLEQEHDAKDVSDAYARVHREALLEDVGTIAREIRKPAPAALQARQQAVDAQLAQAKLALERAGTP
jgi:hypothetical protein